MIRGHSGANKICYREDNERFGWLLSHRDMNGIKMAFCGSFVTAGL
jgi:hypothetical protein